MAPSKSRLPDSEDTSRAATPMTDAHDAAATHNDAANHDENMVVCILWLSFYFLWTSGPPRNITQETKLTSRSFRTYKTRQTTL